MIDAHVHITLPNQRVLHHELEFKDYINEMEGLGGGKGILFLNPFDDKYCCPNSLSDDKLHKSIVHNVSHNMYNISCEYCKTIHYRGEDVFREDNVKLLELASEYNMYALAFLTAPNLSVQNQVDYYESKYPAFIGYKIHPTISMFPADKLDISSNKPIVFHCGNDRFASPEQLIDFANKYSGNVIIAHFARFDKHTLIEISHMDNVWIDMSPFTFLYGLIKTRPEQICDIWSDINYEDDVKKFFDVVASCVGIEKIIFASDAPFGNLSREKKFVDGLHLMSGEYYQVMEGNARCAFGL